MKNQTATGKALMTYSDLGHFTWLLTDFKVTMLKEISQLSIIIYFN